MAKRGKVLSSTPILHSYLTDIVHVVGEGWRNERKGYPSLLTILKTWMLGVKVKDMKDIFIKSNIAGCKKAFYD
jgi:hypothetical protein